MCKFRAVLSSGVILTLLGEAGVFLSSKFDLPTEMVGEMQTSVFFFGGGGGAQGGNE